MAAGTRTERVVVVGAGAGGLAAALDLACAGLDVTLVEATASPGGKMRQTVIGGAAIDAGPTVFTMRWVFDSLFEDAGTSTAATLDLHPISTLARHAWSETERLDLYADKARTADAIGDFAGAAAAQGYLSFCERARCTFELLDPSFIRAEKPSVGGMIMYAGRNRPGDVLKIKPYTTLWRALHEHFRDPRLRQLFGRYATYCGSSPFLASATLMLVAHVEQQGVWHITGGIHRLAQVLAALAQSKGATLRYSSPVQSILVEGGQARGVRLDSGEEIRADAVVFNGDVAALGAGKLGRAAATATPAIDPAGRSQSAITWALVAPTSGFDLVHHNVFFSPDYAAEFDDVFQLGRPPLSPTVYVCAQDRGEQTSLQQTHVASGTPERLLCLINAPANGDQKARQDQEIEQCQLRTFQQLARCGLNVSPAPEATVVTTPQDFERLFPATGGALYGQASHGWMAPFQRPSSRARLPGLYLAGGSSHPGPGVPMATLSGRLAARSVLADLASTSTSRTVVTPGGISTR
jgi:1-hydroxycarotenoid 3,4-desaturase